LVESDEHPALHQLIPFSVDVQPVGGKRKVYRGKPPPASAFAAPNFHFPLRDFEGDALVADRFCKRPDGRRQRVKNQIQPFRRPMPLPLGPSDGPCGFSPV
jgi:hypothetical protein